ncbi:uncharacterized protein BDR25DRAFT_348073 [Lindgomyces ingoldianus]|uniref:Uncharacterized protein n=1 Tax=Lindgomyces ingoldianus TaxID=673940 RepID=A0ACB6RH03_9PLEO|nr:uncharacterized protein BDR25DRAFT_348073 [Lindgomyces ingoldianus]KAF2477756.1 hypothetical protein BDR25DRAFT_348073 [Lindgomyces ingoldianus]
MKLAKDNEATKSARSKFPSLNKMPLLTFILKHLPLTFPKLTSLHTRLLNMTTEATIPFVTVTRKSSSGTRLPYCKSTKMLRFDWWCGPVVLRTKKSVPHLPETGVDPPGLVFGMRRIRYGEPPEGCFLVVARMTTPKFQRIQSALILPRVIMRNWSRRSHLPFRSVEEINRVSGVTFQESQPLTEMSECVLYYREYNYNRRFLGASSTLRVMVLQGRARREIRDLAPFVVCPVHGPFVRIDSLHYVIPCPATPVSECISFSITAYWRLRMALVRRDQTEECGSGVEETYGQDANGTSGTWPVIDLTGDLRQYRN